MKANQTSPLNLKSLLLSALAAAGLLSAPGIAQAQTNVYIDPSKTWNGYMNVFDTNNVYVFGSSWGTADLVATFSGNILTLKPNSIGDPNPFWYTPSGGPGATGNKIMDASMYVEDTTLGGQDVTFSGYCWANTLAPGNDNCTAFVKEFAPGYIFIGITSIPLTNGQPFSVTRSGTFAGNIIQYGFQTIGPCVWITDVGAKGSAIVASNPPPAAPVITGITPPTPAYVTVSSNLSLAASVTGGTAPLTYQWKKNGVNLTNGVNVAGATSATLTLSNVTGAARANYSLVVTDSLNKSATNNSFVVVFDPANLVFDPSAAHLGYINATELNDVYAFGFTYPTALLRARMTNGAVVLQPNTSLYNIADPIWTNPDGTPNKKVEQDYFIQFDELAGRALTFAGFCPSNSLDPSYRATAFIKDLAPDYSSQTVVETNLIAGQSFSISRASTPGNHIQFGFALFGLANSPTNTLTQGAAYMTINAPTLTASASVGQVNLSFPTVTGHDYTVQYKNVLTDVSWSNLGTVVGNGASQTVSDPTSSGQRYYRLLVQ